jgi:hypothetical protein
MSASAPLGRHNKGSASISQLSTAGRSSRDATA